MDISVFISELLYSNDCVIIPGFGGFVAHYAPAKIHPINHSFHPPAKNILFNSKLERDDGLLIDFISEKQSLSYNEAKTIVEEYVEEVRNKISNGGIARFKNIGNLHRDSERKILFSPDESVNYLEEAFGLSAFVSLPISRKTTQKNSEVKFIDRKPVSQKDQKRRKVIWAYAALVPVLFFVGWYIFFGNFRPEHTQQTGIITLPDSEVTFNRNDQPAGELKTDINPPLESLDLSTSNPVVKEIDKKEAESIPVQLVPLKSYYIIGGAFGVEMNADKLVAVLRTKGYDAQRAGLSRSGLHMVSYFRSEDKSEALINLDIIRREDNPSAWLLKK